MSERTVREVIEDAFDLLKKHEHQSNAIIITTTQIIESRLASLQKQIERLEGEKLLLQAVQDKYRESNVLLAKDVGSLKSQLATSNEDSMNVAKERNQLVQQLAAEIKLRDDYSTLYKNLTKAVEELASSGEYSVFETIDNVAIKIKKLKYQLATAEAKGEALKAHWRKKPSSDELRTTKYLWHGQMVALLDTPPSTFLREYLEPVRALLKRIEGPLSDIIALGNCECDIPKGFTCVVCECALLKPELDKQIQLLSTPTPRNEETK